MPWIRLGENSMSYRQRLSTLQCQHAASSNGWRVSLLWLEGRWFPSAGVSATNHVPLSKPSYPWKAPLMRDLYLKARDHFPLFILKDAARPQQMDGLSQSRVYPLSGVLLSGVQGDLTGNTRLSDPKSLLRILLIYSPVNNLFLWLLSRKVSKKELHHLHPFHHHHLKNSSLL